MWVFNSSDRGRKLSNVELETYVDDNHNYTIVYKINGQVRQTGTGRGMSNALRDLAENIDKP